MWFLCVYLSLGFCLQILLILQKYLLITDTYYRYTSLITVKITVLDVVFGFIVSVIGETWTFRLQSLCFDLGLEKRRRKASSNSSRPKQIKLQNPTVAKDCSYKPESIEFLGILSIESEKHQPCLLQ